MNKVSLTRTQSQIIKLVLWLQTHLSEKKEKNKHKRTLLQLQADMTMYI